MIEGATGPNSAIINSAFEVAEWPDNAPPIYRRADRWHGLNRWLFVNSEDNWVVSDRETKNNWAGEREFKNGPRGVAFSEEAAQGRLPHEMGTWKVFDGRKLNKQQLRVLHGKEAEVAIAMVCGYMHTLAHAQMHTGKHTRAHMR